MNANDNENNPVAEDTEIIRRKRDMRLETAVIIAKGFCYLVVGVFTPWAAALAQWTNSEQWPERITWLGVILPASAVGGASQLLAFLSSSFNSYQKEKQANTP